MARYLRYEEIIPRITFSERRRAWLPFFPSGTLSARKSLVRFLDSVWPKSESKFLIRAETGDFLQGSTPKNQRKGSGDGSQDPILALHSKVLTVAMFNPGLFGHESLAHAENLFDKKLSTPEKARRPNLRSASLASGGRENLRARLVPAGSSRCASLCVRRRSVWVFPPALASRSYCSRRKSAANPRKADPAAWPRRPQARTRQR